MLTLTALITTLTLVASHYPDSVKLASAQEPRIENGWNFEFLGGIGVSQIAYQHWGQSAANDHINNHISFPAYTAGLGLNCYFTPWFGIGTGVRYSSYRTKAEFRNAWTYSGVDYYGHAYNQKLSPEDLGEKQEMTFIEIPLLLRFQHRPVDSKVGFTSAIGALLGIPMSMNYKSLSDDGLLRNEVYYPELDATLRNIPTVIENGHVPSYNRSMPMSDLSTINWAAHAKIGVLFHLQQRVYLGLSAYVTYYINDVVKEKSRHPLGFSNCLPAGEYMGSTLYNNAYSSLLATDVVRSVHPWQAGLELSLSIDASRTRAQREYDRQQRLLKRQQRAQEKEEEPIQQEVEVKEEELESLKEQHCDQNRQEILRLAAECGIDLAELANVQTQTIIVHDTVFVPTIVEREKTLDEATQELNKVLDNYIIFFHFDQTEPILEPEDILDNVANVLKAHPTMRVYVTGHTCSIGSTVYNANLSLRRAHAVADRLHALGVPNEQMIIRSVGANEPLKTEGSHSMTKDRRVEIVPLQSKY
ncbi:MAG: OmpA family protein [Bacteroidales bacterium]|nr:OmpA family protein [Bacteroidales bacterium]